MKEIFITKIFIEKVRHLKNFDIPISEKFRKHLIITGKNGSGKTSLLKNLSHYGLYLYNEQEPIDRPPVLLKLSIYEIDVTTFPIIAFDAINDKKETISFNLTYLNSDIASHLINKVYREILDKNIHFELPLNYNQLSDSHAAILNIVIELATYMEKCNTKYNHSRDCIN